MIGRKWPRQARVAAGLALVCALAAFALVRSYTLRLEATRPDLGVPTPIVVAGRDLARGAKLTEEALEVREVPGEFVPPGAVSSVDTVVGRVLVGPLAGGEVLTRTRLAAPRAGPVAALVPPGLRAFVVAAAVPPDAVRAGDRVDLLATFGGARAHTETVATSLEILQVLDPGQPDAISGGSAGTASLVLLVTPDVAERLAYASSFGDLSVTIASAGEETVAAAPATASMGG